MTETIGLAVVNQPTIDPAIDKLFHAYGDVFSIDLAVQLAQQVRDDALEVALTDLRTQIAELKEMNRLERIHAGSIITERNDLATKLAAANAELHNLRIKTQWHPASGYFTDANGGDDTLTVDGRYLVMNAGSESNVTIALPADLRLCWRQP